MMSIDAKIENDKQKALSYLVKIFPAVNQEVFFTDYTGRKSETVIDFMTIAKVADGTLDTHLEPVIKISKGIRNFDFLEVGLKCKKNNPFETMFAKSGLTADYREMTFENYEAKNPEQKFAKLEAIKSAKQNSDLILSGRAGTGKTHLAVSVALTSMKNEKQAVFRLVSEMMNELWQAIETHGDFFGLLKRFKEVPCLVLDDLGKQNSTTARMSYLHEIIDYRYRNGLQTIVTTNAYTPEELSRWNGEEFITPIVSRLMRNGKWVTFKNSSDYRRDNHD